MNEALDCIRPVWLSEKAEARKSKVEKETSSCRHIGPFCKTRELPPRAFQLIWGTCIHAWS